MATLSKYVIRLQQSADERKKSSATTEEAKAKAALKTKIAALESQQVVLAAAVEDALSAAPFNVDKILSLNKEIAQNKADLDSVNSILATEFTA